MSSRSSRRPRARPRRSPRYEAAWRACFAPELADVIEALDAQRDAPAMPVAKKEKDTELLWAEAAKTAAPRSLFAGDWPKSWRDAQRRMRALYQRPRSPLFAAAALELTTRDPLPYTSIASTTYWQAHAWFVAEQGDVRQLDALLAFEARLAHMWGPKRIASDALRAFAPRPLPAKAQDLIAKLAVPAKPVTQAKISLATAEDRAVAADQLQLAGDPRGELITVQDAIAKAPTPALIKRQAQLIKKVIASLPSLRAVRIPLFTDAVLAAGPPTSLEHIVTELPSDDFVGAGLPKLRRLDGGAIERRWVAKAERLEAIGTTDPASWATWRGAKLACAVVFTDGFDHLHRRTPSGPTPWELWAAPDGSVTAKPQVGSTAASLVATLARAGLGAADIVPSPIDPATLGISRECAKSTLQTRISRPRQTG